MVLTNEETTTEQKIERFQKLQKMASDLKTKKITLEAQYKTKKETLKELVKEVKDLGYDPNNLNQIIKDKEAELSNNIAAFEKEVTEVSNKLAEIEG